MTSRCAALGDASVVDLFRKQCAERVEAAENHLAVKGRDGWLFLIEELRHIAAGSFWGTNAAAVSQSTKPDFADPLPAIIDFHKQLQTLGIELIMVPIPPKAFVYPDKIMNQMKTDPLPRLDASHQLFFKLLRKGEILVVDPLPLFLRERAAQAKHLYCKQDSHFSGYACVVLARHLTAELKKRSWYTQTPQSRYEQRQRDTPITGDLWSSLNDASIEREMLPLSYVGTPNNDLSVPVAADPKSPVLLLGDSHCLIFSAGDDMHAKGAGLADQLAYELGFAVDQMGVRGSGSTPARYNLYRRAKRDPAYLRSKKVIIWCFAAREFTESSSGWRVLSVMPN